MGTTINLQPRLNGNGAREAMMTVVAGYCQQNPELDQSISGITDYLLASLWSEGFKVVPREGLEVH